MLSVTWKIFQKFLLVSRNLKAFLTIYSYRAPQISVYEAGLSDCEKLISAVIFPAKQKPKFIHYINYRNLNNDVQKV